ncbi:MAG: thioredoxin family protein [Bacteroidota bacterium]
MRSRFLSLFMLLAGLAVATPGQALTIIDQDLAAAQSMAKDQNKLVLIDFYTTWCGPCKHFSRTLENNPEFAEAIAENFVMLKYDAENDTHGLTRKYHVSAYPTFAVLSADMRLLHKSFGYSDEESYLEFLDEGIALHDKGEFIRGVSNQMDLDYPQFYVDFMAGTARPTPEQLEEYWSANEDKTDEVSFAVISTAGATEEVYAYYLENIDTYRDLYGKVDANDIVQTICVKKLYGAINEGDAQAWADAAAFTEENLGEEGTQLLAYLAPNWYQKQNDWAGLGTYVDEQIEAGVIELGMINGIAWSVYQSCDDQVIIEKAIEWMTPVIEQQPDFSTLDTYAWLYYKNGQLDKARTYIMQAIEAGNAEGADVSDSEAMLPLLEEKKD